MMDPVSLTPRKMAYLGLTHLMLTSQTTLAFSPAHPFPTPTITSTQLQMSRKGNRNPKFKRSIDSPSYASRRRPQINDVMDSITSPPSFPHSVDPADLPPGSVNDDPLAEFVRAIVRAADMRKASDIVAMRVTKCTSLTNFIVVVSGTSRPQNQAIANSVMKDVEEKFDGKRCLGKGVPEGTADSGWILLDYGEVMVHIMTPKSRLFYDIEGQWKTRGGEYMDLSDVLLDEINKSLTNAENSDASNYANENEKDEISIKERLDLAKEDDPFWS
ncbi:hypothetical protein HJC23_003758 [Cyclotella cryptica]|uniref:Uncharacterized protein n=1 Tax=Cyclotella cryptica TaxID=29204 RepID=A0ABD3QTY6_9STRA|eukprot:CCRYP_002167-RB/>CCRYP_002167-RB protein AED:0.25 eAED:0.25 QI:147/1/1/1/0.66/0.5/4/381/272